MDAATKYDEWIAEQEQVLPRATICKCAKMSSIRWIPVPVVVRQPAAVPVFGCDENGWFCDFVIARCLCERVMAFPFSDES